ncbi:hypothetical protein, partial [Ferrovibrio sp.]|uniref:hypothetical protein n=1 Tax=Ferrovibrio sp. TaxID=1917215 RepID=UPI0025C3F43B
MSDEQQVMEPSPKQSRIASWLFRLWIRLQIYYNSQVQKLGRLQVTAIELRLRILEGCLSEINSDPLVDQLYFIAARKLIDPNLFVENVYVGDKLIESVPVRDAYKTNHERIDELIRKFEGDEVVQAAMEIGYNTNLHSAKLRNSPVEIEAFECLLKKNNMRLIDLRIKNVLRLISDSRAQ